MFTIKYEQFLNKSIWTLNEVITGTTTPGQGEPGSNGNENVLYTPQISRTDVSPSYPGHPFLGRESYLSAEGRHK